MYHFYCGKIIDWILSINASVPVLNLNLKYWLSFPYNIVCCFIWLKIESKNKLKVYVQTVQITLYFIFPSHWRFWCNKKTHVSHNLCKTGQNVCKRNTKHCPCVLQSDKLHSHRLISRGYKQVPVRLTRWRRFEDVFFMCFWMLNTNFWVQPRGSVGNSR